MSNYVIYHHLIFGYSVEYSCTSTNIYSSTFFPRIDHIDGVRRKVIKDGSLKGSNVVVMYAETRMNNVHEHVELAVLQYHFLLGLRVRNPKWDNYFGGRTPKQKKGINDFFCNNCDEDPFERMKMLLTITFEF